MNVSVLICTYGSGPNGQKWKELAEWAAASAEGQGALEGTLRVHRHHAYDEGLVASRNYAASIAKGDWLCFLDADDELAPGYLDAMREAAEPDARALAGYTCTNLDHSFDGMVRDELGICPKCEAMKRPRLLVPSVQYIDAGGYESRPRVLNDGRPLHEVNNAVIGTLVPRKLFLEVGGFPEEPIYEDWALWLACVRAGATLVDVPTAIYRAHVRPDSRNLAPGSAAKEVYWRRRREHEAWLESVPSAR